MKIDAFKKLSGSSSSNDLVRFAIICRGGRSGSNLLVNILNQHRPQRILCHSEIFHPKMIGITGDLKIECTVEQRDQDPLGLLETLEQESLAAHPRLYAYGLKAFTNHNPTAVDHIIRSGAYRVIYLCRENLLAQFSSRLIAMQTGEWAKWNKTGDDTEPTKIEFDEKQYEEYLKYIRKHAQRVESMLDESDTQWKRVTYKGVANGDDWDPIGELLCVERLNPKQVGLKKQNTSTVLDRFTNPDDVVTYLNQIGHPEWAEE